MKINDWVVYEYKVVQILRMDGNEVTEVSDGMFRTSGRLNDSCFPLTLGNKRAADVIESYADKVHKSGLLSLNFPDLHRKAADFASRIMSLPEEDRKSVYDEVEKFYRDLFRAIYDVKQMEIDGVRIFGR